MPSGRVGKSGKLVPCRDKRHLECFSLSIALLPTVVFLVRSGQWMSRIFTHLASLSFLARSKGSTRSIPPSLSMDAVEIAETADTLRVRSHVQYNTPDHITPDNVLPSPLEQFHIWFNEARDAGVRDPDAMCLSTATASGIPSSRMVLFKQLDKHGFVFYTNYTSRKSKELEENPNAALLFFWREMSRQVRVVGRAEKMSKEESEAYFKSRPIGSQLGAWASVQSSVIDEDVLQTRVREAYERFDIAEDAREGHVPLPEFWGGWRVIPR